MKKELAKGLLMVLVVTVFALATAAVSAKPQAANKVVASIPFEFSVGYKTLPAGEYTVRVIATAGDGLLIQNDDGTDSVFRLSEATQGKAKDKSHARLVFHRYGERYFLSEVWNGSDDIGRRLIKSQEELALERELAAIASSGDSTHQNYEIVEVMATLR